MKVNELTIEGMSCNHCVMAVKKALNNINGLVVESVEIGKARVRYEDREVTQVQLQKAIDDAGYTLVSLSTDASL